MHTTRKKILALYCRFALLTTILLQGMLPHASVAEERHNSDDGFYRDILRCGPNSLFAFLQMLGKSNVSFDQLEMVQITSNGCSLQDLCDAAAKLGVLTETRRYRDNDIAAVPLPAIVQMKVPDTAITPFHFCIVFALEKGKVHVLESITGELVQYDRSSFGNRWTGYAMIEQRRLDTLLARLGPISVTVLGSCCIGFWFWLRHFRKVND